MIEDNRLPRVIRDLGAKAKGADVLSFLAFDDWRSEKETEAPDWIIVARSWRIQPTDLWTFSVLANASEGNLEKLLAQPKWDVDMDFGKPTFYAYGGERAAHYEPGLTAVKNGIELRPLVVYREFHGYIPSRFELLQSFILYHNLFLVSDKNEYHGIDHNGDIQPVVRITRHQDENQLISISTHHLRDYLAANKCYLIRYHDHRRSSQDDISRHIGGQFKKQILKNASSCFELWLRTDIPWDGYKSSSRLLGKDIVAPYAEPDQNRTWFATGERKRNFASFIIGRDHQGHEIESTCDEDKLSNYFTDRGTPNFLTPVFFQQPVLAKYYDEPSRYRASSSGVACLDLWHIPIDITGEELVQVWLGDLGRLPHKEQLHWRQFNVPPRGTITRHRFLRDFMAEFADPPDDPLRCFWVAFEEIQREATALYAEEFFLRLDERDAHLYRTLHVPLTEEWKEFDEQIQFLAKITIDSMNVALISRESGKNIDGKTIKGSIDLLLSHLPQLGFTHDTSVQVLEPLHALQALRSGGAAHRKGKKFQITLRRYQLDDLSNRKRLEKLLSDIARSLSSLAENMRNRRAT